MSAPPIGSTTALPSSAAQTSMPMKSSSECAPGDQVDAGGEREDQQHEVDGLLRGAERDRPPGEDFLELAEGDVGAPEGDGADDRGEDGEDGDVGGHAGDVVGGAVAAELGPRDQEHRAAADAVEERDHLRHRGHLHLARGGDPDRRPDRDRRARSAPSCPRWRLSSVAMIAISIPTAAMRLPRRRRSGRRARAAPG